jgi:hypothetical protein
MNWESLGWVTLALAAFGLVTSFEAPLQARWPNALPRVRPVAPWVIGVGPAYLALIRGAVLGRTYGLDGRGGPAGWAVSTLLCAALLAVLWGLRRRMAWRVTDRGAIATLPDEPRWALYRAFGLQLLGPWGLLIGLAIGAVEWGLATAVWRPDKDQSAAARLSLIRLSTSTALFALTGNVWLTWATQAAGWSILRMEAASPDGAT